MSTIELLINEWRAMSDLILKAELIDLDNIKDLSRRTHTIMREYSNKESVPKEMCSLYLELQWFSWWVGCAEFSPMHGLYQELGNIVDALHGQFWGDEECKDIESFLDVL